MLTPYFMSEKAMKRFLLALTPGYRMAFFLIAHGKKFKDILDLA